MLAKDNWEKLDHSSTRSIGDVLNNIQYVPMIFPNKMADMRRNMDNTRQLQNGSDGDILGPTWTWIVVVPGKYFFCKFAKRKDTGDFIKLPIEWLRIDSRFTNGGHDGLNGFVQNFNTNINYYKVESFYLNSSSQPSLKSMEKILVSETLPSQIALVDSVAVTSVDSTVDLPESSSTFVENNTASANKIGADLVSYDESSVEISFEGESVASEASSITSEQTNIEEVSLSLVDCDATYDEDQQGLTHTRPRVWKMLSGTSFGGSALDVTNTVAILPELPNATNPESLSVLPIAVDSCCVLCRESTWDHLTNKISKKVLTGKKRKMNPELRYMCCEGCGEKSCHLCV